MEKINKTLSKLIKLNKKIRLKISIKINILSITINKEMLKNKNKIIII